MNTIIKPPTNAQPGPFVPEAIMPEETDDESPASPLLEYAPPPIHRLPEPLAEYVARSAEAIGCDPCLVAMPALAACAAAIGDSHTVEVKAGWIEFAIFWTLIIAPSGQLKSPAMKAAMLGLEAAQSKAFDEYRRAEARHKEEVAKWKSDGMQTAEPAPPQLKTYYVGDATIQAVCKRLGCNPRGLLQKRDELSGWLGGFGQFNTNGNEVAQWLEFHSGGAVRVDRSNGDEPTIYIPHGLVSVTGTIQEPVLRKLLSDGDAKHFDNGLAPRFLMGMPPEIERHWSEQ